MQVEKTSSKLAAARAESVEEHYLQQHLRSDPTCKVQRFLTQIDKANSEDPLLSPWKGSARGFAADGQRVHFAQDHRCFPDSTADRQGKKEPAKLEK